MSSKASYSLAATIAIAVTCSSAAAAVVGSRVPTPIDIPFICQNLADEARAALQDKDYDKAISQLEKAIALNKGDLGANFDPLLYAVHKEDSLWHGRTQLVRMLKDRPLMKAYLKTSDHIWSWACSKYGDSIIGSRIEWDSSELKTELAAEHVMPWDGNPGRIRIRNLSIDPNLSEEDAPKEKSKAFERLWASAVFELYNIQHAKDFEHACNKVINGEMDQKTFVRTMFFIELKSTQLTRKWYVEVFLPHAKKYNLATYPDIWFCSMWGAPISIFNRYTDKKSYPWNPYASYYSELKARSHASQRAEIAPANQGMPNLGVAPQ